MKTLKNIGTVLLFILIIIVLTAIMPTIGASAVFLMIVIGLFIYAAMLRS